MTPEVQSHAVFESFFECTERGSKQTGAIFTKYVDLPTLNDDYEKQYKKKHGIDLAKVSAGHENDPTFVPPPHDEQLWRDVVVAHVKDKSGFCEAVATLSENDPVWPLGDLEQVVVQDDTATGRAQLTIVPRLGESPPTVDKIDKTFKFRRVNGGWLLDSL